MGYTYKLKQEVENFVLLRKRKFPDMGCRQLAKETSEKFNIKISKSSISNLLKREHLSSSVGRRPKLALKTDKLLEYGGVFLFKGIDHFLGISGTAAKVIYDVMPRPLAIDFEDIENTIRCLILYVSIFDVIGNISVLYDNIELWSVIGKRPTKKAFNSIIAMLNDSQLFLEKVVMELRKQFIDVAGFRFVLSDQSSLFLDAQKQSIWDEPQVNRNFYATYYKSISYIDDMCDRSEPLLIFTLQGSSINCPEVNNLIDGLNADDATRRLSSIEIRDMDGEMLEQKFVYGTQIRFFLLGFWPWQLETMFQLERKPARNRISWRQIELSYYYQLEEVIITHPVTFKRVKLIAILFKTTSLGAVKFGVLSNIPKEIIHNYLKIKYLYHWLYPEEKQALFTKLATPPRIPSPSLIDLFAQYNFDEAIDFSLDPTMKMFSDVVFRFFQNTLLPEECRNWDRPKLKDVFLRQKAKILEGREIIVHNLFFNNALCKREHFIYLCQRINNLGINEKGKQYWFQVK